MNSQWCKHNKINKYGVFKGAYGTNLDHGVLAVGFSNDYYLVKNSLGSEEYIKLARGPDYNNGGWTMWNFDECVLSTLE